jgi:hypothetical protein
MLLHSNASAKFSGRKPGAGAWGEELVDQSLATTWYRADWDNVGDDELAYLLPSLCRRRTARAAVAGDAQIGPVDYLTRTLIARAESTAREIARSLGRTDGASISGVLEHLVASRFLTSIATHQYSDLAGAADDLGADFDPVDLQTSHSHTDAADLPGWLIAELTSLAYADRMLKDASEGLTDKGAHAAPIVDWPLSLADVVVATISTRLNGAYVYPEYDSAHELFSLAAVIGHLVQGRAVYLSPFLAGALIDALSSNRATTDDAVVSVLRTYADLAGGANYLMGRAKIISAIGIARLISPRPPIVARDSGRWMWNARLLQRIGEHCWPIQKGA